jgi:asparagine synthase (glutamine-hydrolysing)
MCGLTGVFVRPGTLSSDQIDDTLRRMIAPIVHRGPDDKGTWSDAAAGIGLGFRRLAILDLSEAGHQPMRSESGRFTIVFNGEIYNYKDLARELEAAGAKFRGHSDTEVILAGAERWGVDQTVRRLVGMFAIAIWDADRRRLSLVRDQLGIKPMYVYAKDGVVSFGSELKALRAGPNFDDEIDRDALTSYLRYLYVPAPHSIFRHAIKLAPGHLLHVEDPGQPLPAAVEYWSAEDAARRGLANPFVGSDKDAIDDLETLLRDAVTRQMQSDVPLGALLSGGVDSSVVVALMQEASTRPAETFSIGFDQPEYNEAPYAARVAEHLGTKHSQLILTDRDALAVVPNLAQMFDEPFADASQIPTFLVSQLARKHVTVALSGDGGDELFAGYHRYTRGERLIGLMNRAPRPARRLLARAISGVSPAAWDNIAGAVSPMLPAQLRVRRFGDKSESIAALLNADRSMIAYRSMVSGWHHPEAIVQGGSEELGSFEHLLEAKGVGTLVDRMMLADQGVYLPDDLLTKTDRASMAVSLEVRVPLLDHRVVEFAWRIPLSMKIRDGRGKWLLRQVLHRHVPLALVERPKMGFEVPIAAWLRGSLRPWGEELLSTERLRAGGLNADPIRRAWTELHGGRGNMTHALWAVLMYQAWRERWLS